MSRAATVVGAIVCLTLAAGLLLLARDVTRLRDAASAGDVRYRVAPAERDLWQPAQTTPFGTADRLLGVEDDVAFRRALRSLRLAGIEEPTVSDPRLALLRSDARARLAAVAERDPDAARQSRAIELLGVLSFASAISEAQASQPLFEDAIARFRRAIAVDPTNDEAKLNLEVALVRDAEAGESAGGERPRPGGEGAAGAGATEPGSGY